jgi:hypothetical protein
MSAPHAKPSPSEPPRLPAAHFTFSSPRALVQDPHLTQAQKRQLLYHWAYDAAELEVATEEGMPGSHGDLQREVLLALRALGVNIDTEHSGPTKHHSIHG